MPDDNGYDHQTLLEGARRNLEHEEARRQGAMRTVRWWAAGCLAVATLHGTLPFELLTGMESPVVRGMVICLAASLCGWCWAAWGAVRRLRPRPLTSRSVSWRLAYLGGETVDARRELHEMWGDPDDTKHSDGIVFSLAKEANEADRFAKEVYRLVRRACLVTGIATVASMVIAVLGWSL